MMTRRGGSPWRQRRDDVLDRWSRRRVRPAASASAEPLGAQPHLRHRLFARDIDDALPARASAAAACISSVDLPMPGSPPTRMHRAAHEAAAGHAVEFARCRSAVRGASSVSPESGFERERRVPWPEALGAGPADRRLRAGFLDERVPLAAGLALALPAVVDRAAVLADEGEDVATSSLGHQPLCPRPR